MKLEMLYSSEQLAEHISLLREKVFQTTSKWPQFDLMLNDVEKISNFTKRDSVVVSLERTMLYGGNSLIAPFFQEHKFISIDCSPNSADNRGAYNKELIDDPRFIVHPYDFRSSVETINLENSSVDLILIPNLIHHVKDQNTLFKEISRILKVDGLIYIFEALVRELHQIPDDFLRYTPYGLESILGQYNFEKIESETTGGPFSAISYCWIQALQYFPKLKRDEMEKWFYAEHFKQLLKWDEEYTFNQVRSHTKFPVAFSLIAKKVN
jgi:SAM-dependent methyltransferase